MDVRYYLSIFPLDALIASQLTPPQFGQYMATGRKNGSYEKIMFVEIDGGFGDYFDWKHAERNCVQHENGEPKHSLWMSVYRCLEHAPMSAFRDMHLTTNDGRTLAIPRTEYAPPAVKRAYWVYQELSPVHPLVVSAYEPSVFARHMTHPDVKVRVPKIAFCDMKTVNFDNLEDTGNIGAIYDTNLEHLKACIVSVTGQNVKKVKNVERSRFESFGYQTISRGIYIGTGEHLVEYRMPTVDQVRQHHYDWGRSAMVL